MTMDEKEREAFEDFKKLDIADADVEGVKSSSNSVEKENINVVFIGHVGIKIVGQTSLPKSFRRCRKVHAWWTASIPHRHGRQENSRKV